MTFINPYPAAAVNGLLAYVERVAQTFVHGHNVAGGVVNVVVGRTVGGFALSLPHGVVGKVQVVERCGHLIHFARRVPLNFYIFARVSGKVANSVVAVAARRETITL